MVLSLGPTQLVTANDTSDATSVEARAEHLKLPARRWLLEPSRCETLCPCPYARCYRGARTPRTLYRWRDFCKTPLVRCECPFLLHLARFAHPLPTVALSQVLRVSICLRPAARNNRFPAPPRLLLVAATLPARGLRQGSLAAWESPAPPLSGW